MIAALSEKLKAAAGDVKINIDISAKKCVGDDMGVLEGLTPIAEGASPVDVKHNEGEVILLDFWATWCPPCQKPMQHNQDMLAKRKDWEGKVRIIGASIDQTIGALRKHVEAKGWGSVEHYFRGSSKCDDEFGVQGVPHVCLIDTHGKIVFIGHPASRPDLEKDIDTLLKGETISGKGCSPASGEAEEEGEEGKEITPEMFGTLSKRFLDGCEKLEGVKELATKLQRAFFVLVIDGKVNCETGKMTGEIQCITQLMGDKEASAKI